jgi:hypothetical protein
MRDKPFWSRSAQLFAAKAKASTILLCHADSDGLAADEPQSLHRSEQYGELGNYLLTQVSSSQVDCRFDA